MALLEDQLVFYGAYHSNRWNKLIHFICVPIIFWTALVILTPFGSFADTPEIVPAGLREFFPINVPFFVVLVYSIWYVVLEPFAGILASTLLLGALASSQYFTSVYPSGFLWALGVHIVGWGLQFIGHGLAEGRKPALLDSGVQSIVTAPFFVLLEFLFELGYRPALHKAVEKRIRSKIHELQQKQPKEKQRNGGNKTNKNNKINNKTK